MKHNRKDKNKERKEWKIPSNEERQDLVVNISTYALNETERRLLNKGLSYCPQDKIDWLQLDIDLFSFFRSLKLKVWFSDRTDSEPNVNICTELSLKEFGLFNKSDFSPPIISSGFEMFMTVVSKDINALKENFDRNVSHVSDNLSKTERKALYDLMQNDRIVIKPMLLRVHAVSAKSYIQDTRIPF